jgi:hypothetical protein
MDLKGVTSFTRLKSKTFWRNAVGQIGDVLTCNRNVSESLSTILKVLLLAVRENIKDFSVIFTRVSVSVIRCILTCLAEIS